MCSFRLRSVHLKYWFTHSSSSPKAHWQWHQASFHSADTMWFNSMQHHLQYQRVQWLTLDLQPAQDVHSWRLHAAYALLCSNICFLSQLVVKPGISTLLFSNSTTPHSEITKSKNWKDTVRIILSVSITKYNRTKHNTSSAVCLLNQPFNNVC